MQKEENVIVNTVPSNTKLISIYNSEIKVHNDGIVLERHTAERLGVKKGDIIELNNVKLKVVEISEQSVNRIQYISKEQAQKIGDADLETIILNLKLGKEQELLKHLIGNDSYLYTSFTDLSLKSNEKIFATYDLAAWIIIIFAVVIGFVIVINTALTNLLEQKKKLCMLRVLGFNHNQISRNWFGQSILQFITACVIGLPTGIYIAKIALKKISTVNREYVFVNDSKEYIITILLVFTYLLISHIVAMNSLKKWNITETVKEKE